MKQVLIGALLIGGIGIAQAQSDNATLNVVLDDIQSITVNSAQEIVTLTFDDVADYTNGVFSDQADHLAVVSTVDFDVTVVASSDLDSGTATIPVNTITLLASGGNNAPATATYAPVVMSTATAGTLIDAADADLDAEFNVNYDASGGADYLNKPTGTYTTTITYTLIPN
jgi:hypothetical protein